MDAHDAIAILDAEGAGPSRRWGNGPGDRYGRHDHPYHKVLFCLDGSIVFHLDEGDIELGPGDRLDLPAGTAHAATVGPSGCSCVEGSRPEPA
jgi:hypothetical protein